MCQRVTCHECGKPTFAGCGRHIESVLGDVPLAERCPGHAPKPLPPQGDAPSKGLGRFFDLLTGAKDRKG